MSTTAMAWNDKPISLATDEEIKREAISRGIIRTMGAQKLVPDIYLAQYGADIVDHMKTDIARRIAMELIREGLFVFKKSPSAWAGGKVTFSAALSVSTTDTQ